MQFVAAYIETWSAQVWGTAKALLAYVWNFLDHNWKYVLGVLVVLVLCLVYRKYLHWRQSWLSAHIDQRIRELGGKRRRGRFEALGHLSARTVYVTLRSYLFRFIERAERYLIASPRLIQTYYFPSVASFLLVATVTAVAFYAPRYSALEGLKLGNILETVKDPDAAKKIFEGLAVIAVALIIFVAESIRDAQNPDYRRVLLRISFLWPLTLAVTLFPLGYLIGELTGAVIVLLLVLVACFIYAFSNVLRNLLDPDAREQGLKALLKDRIHSLIMDSVRERVGNNILLQMLGPDKELPLQYLPFGFWSTDKANQYVRVYHSRSGWLSDINLDDLRRLLSLIGDQYQRVKESPRDDGLATVATVTSSTSASATQPESAPNAYLLKRFGEQLGAESLFSTGNAILAVPKELSPYPELMEEIRRRTSQAFKLTTAEPSSLAFRREIRGTKDRLIAAMRTVSVGTVEDLRATYLEIAEEFLKTLHELGGGYSADQARQERSNIFEGWNEVRWLVRDIRELLIVAAATDNPDVIGSIAFLPFAIATRAVVANDHLLFEEFTPFATFIYELAAAKPADAPVRSLMIDRSWRYLFELCEFYVLPFRLESGGKKVDIVEAQAFALFAIKVFQDILKAAFDRGDIATFRTVLDQLGRLFRDFTSDQQFPDAQFLRARANQVDDGPAKSKLLEQLENQEKKENAARAIQMGRQNAIFGLAAHILSKCASGADVDKGRVFYEAMEPSLPADLIELTQVFSEASGIATSDYFGWTNWDLVADGEAHWIDTHSKLDRLYIVRALKLLATIDEAQIDGIAVPSTEAITLLLQRLEADGALAAVTAGVGPDSACGLLTQAEVVRQHSLLSLLRKAKQAADRIEEDELIVARLEEEKLLSFRRHLLASRNKLGHLRALMLSVGAYVDQTHEVPPPDVRAWGFNQLEDKRAFTAQTRITYPSWGEGYGQSMARSENTFGLEPLVAGAARQVSCSVEDIFPVIEAELGKSQLSDPIVIHTLLSHLELVGIDQNDIFIPKYRRDCPNTPYSDLDGFSGVLIFKGRTIPVFSIFAADENLKGRVLIADLGRFASWHQYAPIEDEEEEQNTYEAVFIKVSDLNTDDRLRQKIIDDEPDWLRDKPEKERYLRGRVVVRVYERFEAKIREASAAIAIEVTNL